MTFMEYGRYVAYWFLDFLKGGTVKKYYNDLRQYCAPNVSRDEVWQHQSTAIKELLQKTRQNVPYYAHMTSDNIHSWPVINKSTIKDNKEKFRSIEYADNQLVKMFTSGSTGTPFESLQNIEKKKRVNAETLYYLGLQGYKVGQRIIFLRSLVDECRKSGFEQFYQNIYQIDCNDLSDNGISEKLKEIERLSKNCGAVLIAYASTYEALRKYFERNGIDEARKCKILSITSGSEMLYDITREAMENAFDCKCFSRYANEENGFLGQDGVENNVFFIDESDYYIEVLNFDSDEPAEHGVQGRIVVTDLYNFAQPMIRYDTGDVGALVELEDRGNKRIALGNFGGRVVDSIYNTKGELVSPHAITNAMWEFQQIKQFQFVQQTENAYLIKVNKGNEHLNEQDLLNNIISVVGKDAKVSIEYCDEIPVLASGKRRYIVNESCR